ncbi:MAG TPA: energy-coupling factor transporter transmembrane component T [Coriobacteriia bacterium]
MNRYVGLGQYVPLVSPVHELDAAAKIGITAAFTVGLFLVGGFGGLAGFAALLAVAIAAAKVPPAVALRGLKAVVFILVFTVGANALRWQPATVALVRVGPLAVDSAGLSAGLFFAARIVLLVVGTSLLTLTTSPVELASGIERALSPARLLRLPVGEIAMTLTIALRFIPTTVEEADRIVTAQRARGASFDRGGPLTRARAYAPVLVPLFFNLFRRADELATAMEARCYRGTVGRTRLNERRMRTSDWVALALLGGIFLGMGVIL